MAIALQICKFKNTLHIALISVLLLSLEIGNAQTVLLPGDVVFVSANSSDDSFEFIPLVDIDEGTRLYFSNNIWNKAPQTDPIKECAVVFNSSISAGTVISIGKKTEQKFKIEGILDFSGRTRLFIYQKDDQRNRYLFGMVWGEDSEQHTVPSTDQKYPSTISQNQSTLLELGTAANYQYYIRNGASGTAKMLQHFVSEPTSWRASDQAFPGLGTSFTLLAPPVILFKDSFTTIAEKVGNVTLEVAIYEHDGSRLTVDIAFDSSRSIAGMHDLENFTGQSLNFTGIIGNGSLHVKVPLRNDLIYEGSETGIFALKNLSKGNFGDFIYQSVVIIDDEIPDVKLLNAKNSVSDHSLIVLQNNEKGVISLNGWSLISNDETFYFDDELSILPGEQLNIDPYDHDIFSGRNPDIRLLNKEGGKLQLATPDKTIISRMIYQAASLSAEPKLENTIDPDDHTVSDQWEHKDALQEINIAQKGWKWLPGTKNVFQLFPEIKFIYWNEHQQQFEKADDFVTNSEGIMFGYFEESFLDELEKWDAAFNREKLKENSLELNLSATDFDKNDHIDGLEGLNLLQNDLNIKIPVSTFLKELQKINPTLNLSEYLYVMEYLENGELKINARSGSEKLLPGEPFWMLVKNKQDNISIMVNKNAFLNADADSEVLDQDHPHFTLTATNGYYNDQIEFHFVTDTEQINNPENLKDISAYPAFELSTLQPLNIAVEQGKEFFSVLNFQHVPEQNLSLPVLLSSKAEKIQLEVTEWNNIPAEWNLMLIESKSNKELKLQKGFIHQIDRVESASATGKEASVKPSYYLNIYTSAGKQNAVENTIPKELELFQNYPNPFNPFTTISFFMPEPGEVKLSIFNIVGQPVAILVDGTLSAGHQKFDWDATDLPSGMYIYQLEMGNKVLTRKMTLVK